MCRRFAGSVFVPLFIAFLSAGTARAQDSLPAFVVALIEQLSEDGASAEDWVQYYEQLQLHPLNLNAAGPAELEETGLLTLFQIGSLLEHRARYGAVRSQTEWALIDGFSPGTVARLNPFFSLGEPQAEVRRTQTYTLRLKKKWRQDGFSLTAKSSYEAGPLSLHAVVDNDPLERFPDFVSLSARWNGWVAGDFTARFGQGLVLWKAFSLSAFGTPSSAARRGGGLQAYRSASESGFFRGIGYTHTAGPVTVSAFAARTPVDARIVDGRYTSIATDGLHATETERAKRHAMHEYVTGAHAVLQRGRWQFGLTAAAYAYDKANGRKVQDYNRYQQYDGWWGNLGADVFGTVGSLRVFGEAAIDAHGAPAVLAGTVWSPSYGFESSLMLRAYSPAYIATHAGAWSSVSSVSNQVGALYSLQLIHGGWTLRFHTDAAWYPWKRYRYEAGTWGMKARLQLQYDFPGGAQAEGRLSWSGRLKGNLRAEIPVGGTVVLSARGEANRGGAAAYLDVRWHPGRKWDLSARVTGWRTQDWDSRICFYERGVPQSFSVEAYSGKGVGAYLLAKYAPTRRVELWMKLQQGYCAYFVRIFIPG